MDKMLGWATGGVIPLTILVAGSLSTATPSGQTSQAPTYAIGAVSVTVPTPAGDTEILSTNPKLREFLEARGTFIEGGVLAAYAPTAGLPPSTGSENFQIMDALLGTSPTYRNVDVTAANFVDTADRMRSSLAGC